MENDNNQQPEQQPNNERPNNQQSSYQQPNYQQTSNQQSSYQQPNYQQTSYQQYQNNNQSNLEPPMSLGEWIIVLLLTAIPCVNIIMLFVWGFGRNVKTSKKNYCRAALIFMLIGVVLTIIFYSVIFAALGSMDRGYY